MAQVQAIWRVNGHLSVARDQTGCTRAKALRAALLPADGAGAGAAMAAGGCHCNDAGRREGAPAGGVGSEPRILPGPCLVHSLPPALTGQHKASGTIGFRGNAVTSHWSSCLQMFTLADWAFMILVAELEFVPRYSGQIRSACLAAIAHDCLRVVEYRCSRGLQLVFCPYTRASYLRYLAHLCVVLFTPYINHQCLCCWE